VTSKGRNRGLGKGPVPVSGEFKMMSKNRIALIITASALVFGVAAAPMAMAAESTDSTEHMTKPHTDAMKGDAMKGDAMKGDAMKGHAMKGDAMKGDAMKGDAMKGHAMKGDAMKGDAMKADSTKSEPPAQ
jgi:pentapeptide MXKDX repeat protein